MNVNLKKSIVCLLCLIIFSCQNNDDEMGGADCIPSNITPSMTITKTNINCEEINLIWEVSFGVNISVRAMSECEGDCNTNTFGYSYGVYKKNSQGVDTINSGATFYGKCGSSGGIGHTLNTELGDPQEYFVGDTIVYEVGKFSICPTPGLSPSECGYFNFIPIELPVISDFYVLNESDFCN